MTAPGGRQDDTAENGARRIEAFGPDDRSVLLILGDGFAPGDTNGYADVVEYDRWTGEYRLALTGPGGAATDGDALDASLSSTARFLVVGTYATNIAPGDTNDCADVFVLDQQTGIVVRASLGNGGIEPNGDSFRGYASSDGRFVVFQCHADNLGSQIPESIYLRDLSTGTTRVLPIGFDGSAADSISYVPRISADGRFITYLSQASNLVPGDTNGAQDLFLYDAQTATTTRLNLGGGGVQANGWTDSNELTPDARWVGFNSVATNLHPAAADGSPHTYLLDLASGALSLASVDSNGQVGDGGAPHLSHDGRWVLFSSSANLDASDTDTYVDAFLRDTWSGVTRLVSVSTGGSQGFAAPWDAEASAGALSPSGRLAALSSRLRELVAGDTNSWDLFVHDAQSTCPSIESYCTPKKNTQGCWPHITSGGEPYVSGNSDSFFISAHGVREQTPGALIWSFTSASTPFGGGTLCVASPFARTAMQNSGVFVGSWQPCKGTYSFHMSRAYMSSRGIGPGTTVYAQFWSRDPGYAYPNNVAFTDGLRFSTSP